MTSRRIFDALRRAYLKSHLREVVPSKVKVAMRGAWLAVARRIGYPVSSPRLPRPPLVRGRRPFRLGRVLLACDLNRDYLDFWPSTSRAWREIVGIEPMLVLVASEEHVPTDLRDDPAVVAFEPIEGVHTAFQAQCIRLLYPALIETTGAVMIADIDLYPLRRSYFFDPIRHLDERFFVVYRDERLERAEIDIMFNAALPTTWGEVFDVSTVDDVRSELAQWARGLDYDGRRGWPGWYTDQQMLYSRLMSWSERDERLWIMDDQYCRYSRLNRDKLVAEAGLEAWRIEGMRRLEYSDFNCFVPYSEHREINDRVLALGLEIARERRG
jgi:hypothetical protein